MQRTLYERYRLLIRFFIPYVLILFGALLIGLFAYNKTSDLVESETKNNTLAVLKQTEGILDRRFAEIETIAQLLGNDPKVVSFQYITDPFSGTNPYRTLITEKGLFDYRLTNHFLIDYFLVFKHSELIISPKKVYGLQQFYDIQLQYDDLASEAWTQLMLDQRRSRFYIPAQGAIYENKRYSMVSYVQSFGTRSQFGGAVVVLIDNEQIQGLLSEIVVNQGGFAYIADQEGQIISGVASEGGTVPADPLELLTDHHTEMTINGLKMLVTQTTSAYNGWSYVSAQPLHIVLAKANYIKILTWTIFIITLLVGLFVAALFAYLNSRPLQTLLLELEPPQQDNDSATKRNPLDFIQQSVLDLIHHNEAMKERLAEQLPLLRQAFFDRLLKGRFEDKQDIEQAMSQLRIVWPDRFSVVAILNINTHMGAYSEDVSVEMDLKKIAIHELISKAYIKGMYTQDIDINQIALIINVDAETEQMCEDSLLAVLSDLHRQLTNQFQTKIWIAVGGMYRDIADLSQSYEEASFASNFTQWAEEKPVIFHSEIVYHLETYYYPADMELRLINLVKSGNVIETTKLLQQIYDKNMERSLSVAMRRMLISDMSGTLLKCCEQLSPEDNDFTSGVEVALKVLDLHYSPEEALTLLSESFEEICKKVDMRKKSHNDQLKDDMLHYIDEHYMRSDLSLIMMSEAFQTSEAYISYFFKEQTGVNFSDYVEGVRMAKAKGLLSDSELSINEIANWVGYHSLNTFGRAFKRANGVSATEYRKTNRKE